MDLATYLQTTFPDGLDYETAAQLCVGIYSASGLLPLDVDSASISMLGISQAFAGLAQNGAIRGGVPDETTKYGAEHHPVESMDHWNQVIASIFEKGIEPDLHMVRQLLAHATRPATT